MKFLLLLPALLFVGISVRASDTLTFSGTLNVAKSASYKYKIVVGEAKGKWKGYTVLDEHGVNETRSAVNVVFAKQKHGFVFAEQALISSRAKETSFCSVGGFLKWNEKKNKLHGYFIGRETGNQICGSGTVSFNVPEKAKALMTPSDTDKKSSGPETNFVMKGRSASFKAKSDTVLLSVWDGGLEDHDSLALTLNGNVLHSGFAIVNAKKAFSVPLKKGNNILQIKALNEGAQPPNSARFELNDKGATHTVVSFLKQDEDAVIKISR